MVIRYTILIFFLAVSVFGKTSILTSDSLPYTCASDFQGTAEDPDTLILAGNITSSTDGVEFTTCYHVVFDLSDDTLFFGTGNGNSDWGIRFFGDPQFGYASNIKIMNGAVVHGATDTCLYSECVRFSSGVDIIFDNVDLYITGEDAQGLERPSSSYATYNVEFDGGRWTSDVWGFVSRCQYGGAFARLTNATEAVTGDDYNWKIHDVTLVRSPGQGIVIQGLCYIYDCSLAVDMTNHNWPYVWGGQGSACDGCANSAIILAQELAAGSYIRGNTGRAGTEHQGCDVGMLIQVTHGTVENPVIIEDNDFVVHCGRDQVYWDITAKAFKSRYANDNLIVRNNTFGAQVSDTSLFSDPPYDSSYGGRGAGAILVTQFDEASDWINGRRPDSGCTFENNYCYVEALDADFIDADGIRLAVTNEAQLVMTYSEADMHPTTGYENMFQVKIEYNTSNDYEASKFSLTRSHSDTTVDYTIYTGDTADIKWYYWWSCRSHDGAGDTVWSDTVGVDSIVNGERYWYDSAGNTFAGNYIESPGRGKRIGEYDGACDGLTMTGDTLKKADNYSTNFETYHLGSYQTHSGNLNRDRDAVYLNGATYDDIIFDSDNSGERNIYIERTCTLTVMGNNALPVPDASVWAVSSYDNDTLLAGTSDANGRVIGVLSVWYEAHTTPDSTLFNDYTIGGNYLVDTTTMDTCTVLPTNYNFVINLSETEGTGTPNKRTWFRQ